MSPSGDPAREGTFLCPASARLLPWVLAAATIAASLVLAARIDPGGRVPNSGVMKALLVAAAAVLGARIVLSLAELGLEARVRERDLLLELRSRMASLSWDDILRLDWDPPFRHYGRWPPALVLVHRRGQRFRIPALIAGGDRLVEDLLARSGRPDLAGWAGAHRLAVRMARAKWWIAGGYVAAACIVAVAAAAPLR